MIASTTLGAGIGLGSLADDLPGEVWVIGTPAEEIDGAKCTMAQKGVFNDLEKDWLWLDWMYWKIKNFAERCALNLIKEPDR